jgi:hypothetical protein
MLANSDMFKKIKGLFIIEEPGAQNTVENDKVQDTSVSGTTSESITIKPPVAVSSDAKVDPKFTDLLLRAIESNNMDGFDYLEYKNSLKSIEGVIPDESMRYKSAFEMAKTMGLSKEKLVQSANHYLTVLTSEDKKFKDALENQKAKQIQGRTDQLATIEKAIVDKQKMIDNLTKEIEASKEQLKSVRGEINDAVVKIDATNNQFMTSYNLVYGQIYADIEKINKNL